MRVQTFPISGHPQSLADRKGRLFESGTYIFRGISDACAPFYGSVLASPKLNRLFSLGLIGTAQADLPIDGYELVLEHPRIDFVSYWPEWSSLMLRDAAVMICGLNLELIRNGYGILDCHPWNVLFDFGRPVFVDFAAIIPLEESWLNEMAGRFRNYWILPLTFISMGHPWFARSIRKTPDVGEPIDDFLKRRELRWFPWWYFRLARRARSEPLAFFERLKSSLESLRLPMSRPDKSGSKKDAGHARHDEFAQWGAKARTVHSLLNQLRPKTVLDIGCGEGWYSILAERMGAKVIAFDWDENYVNSLYSEAKSRKILPLLVDFSVPTPSHGRKCEFPCATERLSCEVSLLLGVIHHLIFDLDLSFERIARLLWAYTGKYSIIEFVSPEDDYIAERIGPRFDWYRMENFIKKMESYFQLIGVFASKPPDKILLFQKRH